MKKERVKGKEFLQWQRDDIVRNIELEKGVIELFLCLFTYCACLFTTLFHSISLSLSLSKKKKKDGIIFCGNTWNIRSIIPTTSLSSFLTYVVVVIISSSSSSSIKEEEILWLVEIKIIICVYFGRNENYDDFEAWKNRVKRDWL